MTVSILVDLLISAPVVVFLLWLYAHSASGGLSVLDRVVLVLTPVAAVAIILGFHAMLEIEGMGLNVIAVATAYLAVLALLGLGWTVRFLNRA